jgi:hypothetical protein
MYTFVLTAVPATFMARRLRGERVGMLDMVQLNTDCTKGSYPIDGGLPLRSSEVTRPVLLAGGKISRPHFPKTTAIFGTAHRKIFHAYGLTFHFKTACFI